MNNKPSLSVFRALSSLLPNCRTIHLLDQDTALLIAVALASMIDSIDQSIDGWIDQLVHQS